MDKNLSLQAANLPPILKKIRPPRTLKDAKELLGSLISAFLKRQLDGNDARTLCYMITSFTVVCTQSDLEVRIKNLEKMIAMKGVP